jgi:hypothetical protein
LTGSAVRAISNTDHADIADRSIAGISATLQRATRRNRRPSA